MIERLNKTWLSQVLNGVSILCIAIGLADPPFIMAAEASGDSDVVARPALLKDMRSAAAAIKVSENVDQQVHRAKLVEEPIFRYTDEQRKIRDATMWIWTVEGRPVSVLKLERYGFPDSAKRWLYNLGSVSPNTLEVAWPFDHVFRSKKPGLTFQPLPESISPAETKATRLIQIKQMARRFTFTMQEDVSGQTEMRLLTTPLYQYASESAEILDGCLFGFSATGTNPDAIVAIQLRGTKLKSATWEYAAMGTTTAGLQLRLDEKQVWSQPNLIGQGQVFDTWTWFFSERTE